MAETYCATVVTLLNHHAPAASLLHRGHGVLNPGVLPVVLGAHLHVW